MHDFLNKRVQYSAAATSVASIGDKLVFSPAKPIDVIAFGIVYETAKDATAFVLALDKAPTAGSATGRTEQYTISDSAARAQGVAVVKQLLGPNPNSSTGSDGSSVNVARGGPVEINPGQSVVLEVTDAAGTGAGTLFIEYIEKDDNGTRYSVVAG